MVDGHGRRAFLKAGGAVTTGVVAGCVGSGNSSTYPDGTVEIVVPYATGGGFDAYARLMAPYLEDELGTEVTVRNVTGGGGVVGGTQAYNADPDGHTLLIWDTLQPVMNQIGHDVDYDIREMSHVGYVTQAPNALSLMERAGIDAWNAFVDDVSNLTFATQGRGSISHIDMALLAGMTGEFGFDEINFVHYGGTGEALSGLEREEANAFMVGGAIGAVKVVQALEAEMFAIFSDPGAIEGYTDENGVDVENWGSELDVQRVDQFSDLTVFRRFVTGPPEVPDEVQQVQQEAFDSIVANDEFLAEARDAARPLINPETGADTVGAALENSFDALSEDPYRGLIQDALSD